MKEKYKQELKLNISVSLTIDAKYSEDELREIVLRGTKAMFPNNHKEFHSITFEEEASIYELDEKRVVEII